MSYYDYCPACKQTQQIHQEFTNVTITLDSEGRVTKHPSRVITTRSCKCGTMATVGTIIFMEQAEQERKNIMHPDNEQDKKSIDVSWLISQIGEAIKEANVVAAQVARGTGGREISLCITKLEEARHRAVDAMVLLQPASPAPEEGR